MSLPALPGHLWRGWQWEWGIFLAQGGEMLGTGLWESRPQNSCRQIRKSHDSDLNSQTRLLCTSPGSRV